MRLLFRFWLPHIPTHVRVPSELTRARACNVRSIFERERERETSSASLALLFVRDSSRKKNAKPPRITRCGQRVAYSSDATREQRPFFSFFSFPPSLSSVSFLLTENKRTALPSHKSLFRLIRSGGDGGAIETCREDYNGEYQKMKRMATES